MRHAPRGARWSCTCALLLTASALFPAHTFAQPASGVDEVEIPYTPRPASRGGDVEEAEAPEAPDVEARAAEQEAVMDDYFAQEELEPGADRGTGIEGRIVAEDTGHGLPEAPVMIEGRGRTRPVITDEEGRYRLQLPPGRYAVWSYFDLYHGARMEGVRVGRGRMAEVTLVLEPIEAEDVAVEELEIAYRADTSGALAQQNLRRETVGSVDNISAEQISQSGDSDAGSAARRVVGVTVDQNSQLIVRGLGGRYSTVLLNGVPVPSTDPDRPGVQLDIFPTSLLSSLSISKGFRPDLPANWAGGVMEINTTTFPEELLLSASISLGYNSESTFRDRLDYRGGSRDFLGVDDGTRELPADFPDEELVASRSGPFSTREEINQFGRRLPNIWQFEQTTALPSMGLGLALGNSHEWREDHRVGYLLTFDYGVDYRRQISFLQPDPVFVDPDTPADQRPCPDPVSDVCPQSTFNQETGRMEVLWGTLGTISLQLGNDHELSALTMFNRSATDTTRRRRGIDVNEGSIDAWQLRFVSRSILFNQLSGDHRNLFGTRLRWRWNAYVATGERDEPDTRGVLYSDARSTTGELLWIEKDQSGSRFFTELDQIDFGGGTQLRFPLWSEAWGTIGGRVSYTGRDFTNRRFILRPIPYNPSTDEGLREEDRLAPPETLFCPDCADSGIGEWVFFNENTRQDDSYESVQLLYAAFAQLETRLGDDFRLLTGARAEIYDQRVESVSPFPNQQVDDDVPRTERVDVDVLPAVQLVWQLNDEMYLRSGYGMTVARPLVRELAPFQFFDFVRNRLIIGNPDLQRTRIQNVDLRWEWFFGTEEQTTEILAVSLFYKQFRDPIELVVRSTENIAARFENADGARNVGVEIEGQLNFERLHESLRFFSLSGNLAVLFSRVQLDPSIAGSVTNSERRLFGQSPYVANLSLRFDESDSGVGLGLVYNVIGPRITTAGVVVGTGSLPDEEQQPFHALDFVASWQVNEHLSLKFKAKNLLFEEQEYRAGGLLTERTRPGSNFSLGLGLTY